MLRFTNVDHKPTQATPIYRFLIHPLLPLRQALDPLISQINQLDEFIMIAKASCHYPSEHDLTHEESASIFLYTMDWGEQSLYRVLNAALRINDQSVLLPWHGYLKLFDTALKKLPSRHSILWRGVTVDIKINYKEDEELIWWSYSSCSSLVSVLQKFLGPASTLFLINTKNGKDISMYSNFPHEKEVILGLSTRLRVVGGELNLPALNVVQLTEFFDEDTYKLLSAPNHSSNSKGRSNTDASRYDDWPSNERKYTNNGAERRNIGLDLPISTDDNRYKGHYNNGKINGKGTYIYPSGSTYTGDWVDGQKMGQGVFTWSSGDRYEIRYSQIFCDQFLPWFMCNEIQRQ